MLGGAFNPPHLGHLELAQAARDQLELELVLLVVTGSAPHKQIEPDPGAEVRLDLTRRAVEGIGGLEASSLEVDRMGPSYMYETLEELGAKGVAEPVWLICGADIAATLPRWERPERVIELANLAVAPREGTDDSAVASAIESLGQDPSERLVELDFAPRDISSTEVRRRCESGESIDDLVPPAVSASIAALELYR